MHALGKYPGSRNVSERANLTHDLGHLGRTIGPQLTIWATELASVSRIWATELARKPIRARSTTVRARSTTVVPSDAPGVDGRHYSCRARTQASPHIVSLEADISRPSSGVR
eukprot:1297103-Prymnesium_polylepis.1